MVEGAAKLKFSAPFIDSLDTLVVLDGGTITAEIELDGEMCLYEISCWIRIAMIWTAK
jgi:hypothetical protein